jgi:hypothetical protein
MDELTDGAIDRPVHFSTGTLVGQTLRAELKVLQDGGFTRKYVRRPAIHRRVLTHCTPSGPGRGIVGCWTLPKSYNFCSSGQ